MALLQIEPPFFRDIEITQSISRPIELEALTEVRVMIRFLSAVCQVLHKPAHRAHESSFNILQTQKNVVKIKWYRSLSDVYFCRRQNFYHVGEDFY